MKLYEDGKEKQLEPEVKKYMDAVARQLNMPAKTRNHVILDLVVGVEYRRRAGEPFDKIFDSMGTPAQMANNLNNAMKDYTWRQKPLRFFFLILALVGLLFFLQVLGVPILTSPSESHSMGVIGGADGPTAIFVSGSVWALVLLGILSLGLIALGLFGWWKLAHLPPKKVYKEK